MNCIDADGREHGLWWQWRKDDNYHDCSLRVQRQCVKSIQPHERILYILLQQLRKSSGRKVEKRMSIGVDCGLDAEWEIEFGWECEIQDRRNDLQRWFAVRKWNMTMVIHHITKCLSSCWLKRPTPDESVTTTTNQMIEHMFWLSGESQQQALQTAVYRTFLTQHDTRKTRFAYIESVMTFTAETTSTRPRKHWQSTVQLIFTWEWRDVWACKSRAIHKNR